MNRKRSFFQSKNILSRGVNHMIPFSNVVVWLPSPLHLAEVKCEVNSVATKPQSGLGGWLSLIFF